VFTEDAWAERMRAAELRGEDQETLQRIWDEFRATDCCC
jgi:hypothetical protein